MNLLFFNYIGDFSNISAQLNLYQRFSKFIGVTQFISAIFEIYRLTDKSRQRKGGCWNNLPFLCFYTCFPFYFFYDMPFLIPLYGTVIRVMIKRKPSIVFSAVLHPLLLIFNRCHWIIIICHYP